MTEQKTAEPKEEVPDTADSIVTRIEANVARMHTATPSGIEAIQAEMTADLEKLRATAPPPDPPVAHRTPGETRGQAKAADDDDDDNDDNDKHSKGKRK